MVRRLISLLAAFWAVVALAQQPVGPVSQERPKTDARSRAKVHTELGAMYFEAASPAVALDEVRVALEADPNYAPAYSLRGLINQFLRETGAAEEDFRKALSLAPNDPEINNNYGWYLCQTGKERQSIRYFLVAVRNPLYSTPDRAYLNAGTCAARYGDVNEAEEYLLRAIQGAKDGAPAAKVQLAGLHLRRGKVVAAQRMVEEGLQLMAPPTPEALWLGIKIQRLAGNRAAEGDYAAVLRRLYPASREYQEFLKGNYE